MFNPDQPIRSRKDDILGRDLYSESLGKAILSYEKNDSIVIGLFGAWGSGKTSIINMALEFIDSEYKASEQKPIIVKFNPWNFSDQNQLITQFFNQLSIVLKKDNYAGNLRKVGEKLETYAKFFEPLKFVPIVGQYTDLIKDTVMATGDGLKGLGKQGQLDLAGVRKELNTLLLKQTSKIIVVIDDIDRLNSTEIRQVFQLVKSLGDFPNTIYLLAFDKNVVINALRKVQEGSGDEYLEKVVQIPFEVPLISKQEVEKLLFEQLDVLVQGCLEKKFDHAYWTNVYHSGMKYFFNNIRDVTRYINSLNFSFDLVKEEVNIVDLFAVTTLQVLLPKVYYGIRDNKDVFVESLQSLFYLTDDSYKQQLQYRCDQVIGYAEGISQEVLREFLKCLFPKLESIYGNTTYGDESKGNWRKLGRICSPDNFDIYFSLSVPAAEVSQTEMEYIVTLTSSHDEFSNALLKLHKEGRIIRFLERLEDYTKDGIPKSNIENIICVVMNLGDLFPKGNQFFVGFDTPMRISRIIYQLIHRYKNQNERYQILKKAIEKTEKSIFSVVHEVEVLGLEHGKYRPDGIGKLGEIQTVSTRQLEDLEKLAKTKIERWAKSGALNRHRNLIGILYRWKDWGRQKDVNDFVRQLIKDEQGLVTFITAFLQKSIKTKKQGRIHIDSVKDFIPIEEAGTRIRAIKPSAFLGKLNEDERLAINIFLNALNEENR